MEAEAKTDERAAAELLCEALASAPFFAPSRRRRWHRLPEAVYKCWGATLPETDVQDLVSESAGSLFWRTFIAMDVP